MVSSAISSDEVVDLAAADIPVPVSTLQIRPKSFRAYSFFSLYQDRATPFGMPGHAGARDGFLSSGLAMIGVNRDKPQILTLWRSKANAGG